MNNVEFYIDENKHTFSVDNTSEFRFGSNEVLSGKETDISYNQPWYDEGYTEKKFLSINEFDSLTKGLVASIRKIIEEETSIITDGFTLDKYHLYVKTDRDHYKIVSRTRDLFPNDFNFPISELLPRLEQILGYKLTDINIKDQEQLHIIVRINRPRSKDFNPPHKDIYEGVDVESYIPQFINFWIPIAGVTNNSSLPIVPRSHKINENEILRTFEGAIIEGNKYRVRMIKSWNNDCKLIRSTVGYGQVLIFSSHLIHGLAVNDEDDLTRVALEFRLFKKTEN